MTDISAIGPKELKLVEPGWPSEVCLLMNINKATLGAYVQHYRASLCLVMYPIESWVLIDHHEYH